MTYSAFLPQHSFTVANPTTEQVATIEGADGMSFSQFVGVTYVTSTRLEGDVLDGTWDARNERLAILFDAISDK